MTDIAANPMIDDRISVQTGPELRTQNLSGTYVWSRRLSSVDISDGSNGRPAGMLDGPDPTGSAAPTLLREELRLDVDGTHPQMMASGASFGLLTGPRSWIARLQRKSARKYSGQVWYTEGYTGQPFPYTRVDIETSASPTPAQQSAKVTFAGRGVRKLTRTYRFETSWFRPVDFEFDSTVDAVPVLEYDSHDHPNRPTSLPGTRLSLESVFGQAGFEVTTSPGCNVPLSVAGANGTWSDNELHDAMQTYWSRFANAPQWALWTFFARLHDTGAKLGGIMFDDIGPHHRQGTAVFTGSFIGDAPAGDPAPEAFVRRMRFWTAAHEMGHAFNLAHSWQKTLPNYPAPWIPTPNAPEARSFMNYPFNVAGGQTAFFSDVEFRFSDEELLFLRHAPARFVQQGNANWFDHHGFEQAYALLPPADFRLQVRANRARAIFDFLEPVVLELKLTNISGQPRTLPADVLDPHHVVTIIERSGKDARQWVPFAQRCTTADPTVLQPGRSLYAALPVFAGLNGWDVSDPGTYAITAVLDIQGRPVRSEPFSLRVTPPHSHAEEYLAGDFLTEDVGRVLAFNGTAVDTDANDVLRETIDRFPASPAAIHAAAAVAAPLVRDYKLLDIPGTGSSPTSAVEAGAAVRTREADVEAALRLAGRALASPAAATSLGHIGMHGIVDAFSEGLAAHGASDAAATLQGDLHQVFEQRGVLERVLDDVAAKAASFGPGPT